MAAGLSTIKKGIPFILVQSGKTVIKPLLRIEAAFMNLIRKLDMIFILSSVI